MAGTVGKRRAVVGLAVATMALGGIGAAVGWMTDEERPSKSAPAADNAKVPGGGKPSPGDISATSRPRASTPSTPSAPERESSWTPTHHGDSARAVVIARGGVLVQRSTHHAGQALDVIGRSQVAWIGCKKEGRDIAGNGIWYRLADRPGYIPARFTVNVEQVRWC